ncbi:MAG: class C sortase [Ruminococcaceae bacterium]|nr:class C sortase [Oscillospiraceae bacterium]MBE6996431.1 class C sortase [Oscillospiraceae bacterium]
MRGKKKQGSASTVLLIVIFLAGLSLLLYPTVSNWWNNRNQKQVIETYTQSVNDLNAEKYAALLAEAEAYNRTLWNSGDISALPEDRLLQYDALLNVSGTGVMGYIEIPSINCTLPIYHGTDEAVLQVAIGHLEWTSLPVGGESTHSVISGHRGLPSAELLTHIDKLDIGDKFYIHVLDKTLEYRVDNVAVVEPDDTELLRITEGKDYMTLVTCPPYGINSHRLLVRGERVETGGAAVGGQINVNNEVRSVHLMYVIPVALVLIVLAAGLLLWIENKRKNVYHGKHTKRNRRLQRGEEYE